MFGYFNLPSVNPLFAQINGGVLGFFAIFAGKNLFLVKFQEFCKIMGAGNRMIWCLGAAFTIFECFTLEKWCAK